MAGVRRGGPRVSSSQLRSVRIQGGIEPSVGKGVNHKRSHYGGGQINGMIPTAVIAIKTGRSTGRAPGLPTVGAENLAFAGFVPPTSGQRGGASGLRWGRIRLRNERLGGGAGIDTSRWVRTA